jgi:hypothetical protein
VSNPEYYIWSYLIGSILSTIYLFFMRKWQLIYFYLKLIDIWFDKNMKVQELKKLTMHIAWIYF